MVKHSKIQIYPWLFNFLTLDLNLPQLSPTHISAAEICNLIPAK